MFTEEYFKLNPPPPSPPSQPGPSGDLGARPKELKKSQKYLKAQEINKNYAPGTVQLALSMGLRAENKRSAATAIDCGIIGCEIFQSGILI